MTLKHPSLILASKVCQASFGSHFFVLCFLSIAQDDWDEDAPFQIPDPSASMPSGWLEEEQLKIPDPKSQRRSCM